MKSLFKALTWLVGIVVVLVAAVAIGVLTLVDPNDFKEEIAAAAKENTGRELTIVGDMEMTVFPWLGVKIGKVTLGNAAGFKSDVFAGSERVEARVHVVEAARRRRRAPGEPRVLQGLRRGQAVLGVRLQKAAE